MSKFQVKFFESDPVWGSLTVVASRLGEGEEEVVVISGNTDNCYIVYRMDGEYQDYAEVREIDYNKVRHLNKIEIRNFIEKEFPTED